MYRILVVDDEPMITELLQEALSRFGYSVQTASSAGEAIFRFEEEPFDLVITDIFMPGKSGTFLARYVRDSDRSRVPVMGISGTPWVAGEDLFDKVLPKPFTLETLRMSVEGLLAGPVIPYERTGECETVARA